MALAGLFVDCTCESQPSSCAFSCGPIKRERGKSELAEKCTIYKTIHDTKSLLNLFGTKIA